MSVVVQRTNPDRIRGSVMDTWRCAACRAVLSTESEARDCAVEDHASGRHKGGPSARYRVDVPDVVSPPCAVAS